MLLLDAIAHVETGNKIVIVQDRGGIAVSRFGIHKEVWQDVHRRFGTHRPNEQFLDVGERYEDIAGTDYLSDRRARNCAIGNVVLIEEYLLKHRVLTNSANIYCCWNLGRFGYRLRHFNLAECPPRTIKAAAVVTKLANRPDQKT